MVMVVEYQKEKKCPDLWHVRNCEIISTDNMLTFLFSLVQVQIQSLKSSFGPKQNTKVFWKTPTENF